MEMSTWPPATVMKRQLVTMTQMVVATIPEGNRQNWAMLSFPKASVNLFSIRLSVYQFTVLRRDKAKLGSFPSFHQIKLNVHLTTQERAYAWEISHILRLTHRNEDITFLTEISLNKSHILTNSFLHGWYFLYISSILLIIPNRVRASEVCEGEASHALGYTAAPFEVCGHHEASHQHHSFHICLWFLWPTNSSSSVLSKTAWVSRTFKEWLLC